MFETLIVGSLIQKELIGQTIGESTKSIFHNLGSILNDEFELKNVVEELDIISKMDIVNNLINKLDHSKDISDTIHKSLHYLHEIIEIINHEIKVINKEIEEHKNLWFHKFRTPSYLSKVQKLVKHNGVFDKRLDLLIKLLGLNQKF